MPFVARVRSITTGVAGSPFYTNLYFTSNPGSDDPSDWVAAVAAFWDDLDLYISDTLSVVVEGEISVIDVATGQQTNAYSVAPATHDFSDSGDPLPTATQGLIRWQTSGFANGRRIRGHTFIPGMTETRNTGGIPDPAALAAMQAAADVLIADAPTELVVYSPTHHVYEPVDTANPWTKWAVLRSRRD